MEQQEIDLRKEPDRCPECLGIGAVIDRHPYHGLIYECFHCEVSTTCKGIINNVPLAWVVVGGRKKKGVIG